MANTKISALTSATTPLAGTETLPVVQSAATTKVTVANLTAGRAVAALSYTSTSGVSFNTSYTSSVAGFIYCDNISGGGAVLNFRKGRDIGTGGVDGVGLDALNTAANTVVPMILRGSPLYINDGTATNKFENGNLIPGTAAKGINFTANTPAAGMTSQLLNWYETGTWTPVVTASIGSITSYTSSGNYTRVGNVVTISGFITITNNGTGLGNGNVSGLPFTVGGQGASGCSRSAAAGGHMVNIQVLSGGTSFTMWKYDNTYPFLTSSELAFSFSYLV